MWHLGWGWKVPVGASLLAPPPPAVGPVPHVASTRPGGLVPGSALDKQLALVLASQEEAFFAAARMLARQFAIHPEE